MASEFHAQAAVTEPDGLSMNIAADKLRQLQQLFPEVFAEGRVDFAKLKAALGETVPAPTDERYGLSWPGKSDAFREIQKQTTATLVPDHAGSVDFATSGNIFIEGENLEVLRVLQKSYYGKVKMIYIDPPYNTGNDSFVYPDDYSERREEYEQRAGLRDEEGFLNKQDLWRKNAKENGQFHSVWLSMMYPRLYLARNLLREDGVIFVSIDDNEVANLRLLMDEVFGEENFIEMIIWKKRSTPPNDKIIGASHDYILIYCRDRDSVLLNLRKRSQEQIARYKNPDNHPKGPWTAGDLMANVKGGRYVKSLYFPIVNPNTGEKHYPSSNGNWRFNQDKIQELLDNNEIYFGEDGRGRPKLKRFLCDVKTGITYTTLWDFVPLNTDGSLEIAALLGNLTVFDNPKPRGLIKELLRLGSADNSLILDFFAGSGTTAHAVLELNREDGGNRKFICVQMPEATDENSEAHRAGYRTIADIARARIRKVSEKLRAQQGNALDFGETPQDTGFKSFTLHTSNFRQWRGDISGEELAEQMELFLDAAAPDAQKENMLFELLLKAGIPLTARVETVQVGEHSFYHVPDYGLCIVFEAITPEVVEAIQERTPRQVICLDSLFRDNDQFLTNTRLQLRDAGITLTVI